MIVFVLPTMRFWPFKAALGIVPQANWHLIEGNGEWGTGGGSQFWHFVTPSNTLQLTWQNALFERQTNAPVSVQMEIWPSGRFAYRYDLSRLNADTVSNVLAGASFGGGAWTTNAFPTNVTSMAFWPLTSEDADDPDPDDDGLATIDELFFYGTDPDDPDSDLDGLSDYGELFVHGSDPLEPYSVGGPYSDGLAVVIGDLDPFSCPEGSTNTVLEHAFYSGATNGAFAYPQSSDGVAVLRVSVSGSGTGDLIVGSKVVPLVAPPQMRSESPTATTLLVPLVRGVSHRLFLRGDDTLEVALDSGDFAFGVLPSWNDMRPSGFVNFPNAVATTPCIHDFNTRMKVVHLPVGEGAGLLACTWQGGNDVEIENDPPRSAAITGNFPARSTRGMTYTLSHPQYLFGQTSYDQTVRFCPRPEDPDPEHPDPLWYSEGDGGKSRRSADKSGRHVDISLQPVTYLCAQTT